MATGRIQKLLVAVERQDDPVGDVEVGGSPSGLYRVNDLACPALDPQVLVDLELERHGVRAFALDLVARQRLHRDEQVLGAERVLGAADVDPDRPPVPQLRRDPCAGSSPATAAATSGICLPKRGPSVR